MKKPPAAKNKARAPSSKKLGSNWGDMGLNKNLIVKIRPVIEGNFEGGQGEQTYNVDPAAPIVESLFEDAEFTIESQYSTPFESSNPEGRLPNLMGMIQSGQVSATFYSFFAHVNDPTGVSGAVADVGAAIADTTGFSAKGALEVAEKEFQGLLGKSNFTKLNSRQIFTSSNSVRISGSLVFQAWANAKTEVEDALEQLQVWASPRTLSAKSLLVSGATDGLKGMFPSEIPPLVQLQYGGKTYSPMVIESVSAPITAPMNKDGHRIAVKAQISFLSLTAWDAQNIANMRR